MEGWRWPAGRLVLGRVGALHGSAFPSDLWWGLARSGRESTLLSDD